MHINSLWRTILMCDPYPQRLRMSANTCLSVDRYPRTYGYYALVQSALVNGDMIKHTLTDRKYATNNRHFCTNYDTFVHCV